MSSAFMYAEIWSEVESAGGSRLWVIPAKYLQRLPYSRTVDVPEAATLEVLAVWPRVSSIAFGAVVRQCFVDDADDLEWRITDVSFGNGPDGRVCSADLDPIMADLTRGTYTEYDANGVALHDYSAIGITTEEVVDEVMIPSLEEQGVAHIAKGTIEVDNEFDIAIADGDNTQSVAEQLVEHAPSEKQLRRNGGTDWRLDFLDEIGSGLTPIRAKTGLNLQRWKRTYLAEQTFNRLRLRGAEDGTHRDISWAPWLVVTVNTSGSNYIEVEDIRGTPKLGPAVLADQFNGGFARTVESVPAEEEITDTIVQSATRTRLMVADASGFTVGDWMEFIDADGNRVWYLDNPAAQVTHGGVYLQTLDDESQSGAVNYARDPYLAEWASTFTFTSPTATSYAYNTASPTVARTGGFDCTAYTLPGDAVLRASDDAVVGTVQSVVSGSITLTANAAVTATETTIKIRRTIPTGWTVPTGAPLAASTFHATHETDGTNLGPDHWKWVLSAAAGGVVIRSRVFTVDKAQLWRFWLWLNITTITTAQVLVTLKRADTNGTIATADTLTSAHDGTRVRVPFEGDDISASATGVYIEISIGSGGATLSIEGIGCQPAAWTEPVDTDVQRACDLWHAANQKLLLAHVPAGYELDIADLESLEGMPEKGQTIRLHDQDLGVEVELRAMEIHRESLDPAQTRFRLGVRQETYEEMLQRRAAKLNTIGKTARALAAGLVQAVTDGLVSNTQTVIQADVEDGSGPTGDTVSIGAQALTEGLVIPFLTGFARKR